MNPTSIEVIHTVLGGTYTARGDAVAVVEGLKDAGFTIVAGPEGVDPAEIEWSWRYRQRVT